MLHTFTLTESGGEYTLSVWFLQTPTIDSYILIQTICNTNIRDEAL